MELRLLSNFYDIPHEHYLLNLIFTEGLDCFHLRKKNYSEEQYRQYIDRIPSCFHNRVIIHDCFQLTNVFDLHGAHFTKRYRLEDYLHQTQLDSHAGMFKKIGFSLHTMSEIAQYHDTYDYLFLSPLFDSISNKGYNSKFNLKSLKNYLKEPSSRPRVIGLGGMNLDRIPSAINLGLDGIALLGYIWSDFESNGDLLAAIKRFVDIRNIIKP